MRNGEKSRKVAELIYKGHWVVIRDNHKLNPYKVVLKYWKDGGVHSMIVVRYADLASAMCELARLAMR